MRFIITGGSGFVGRHLIRKLHTLFPKTEIHNIDINQLDELSNISVHHNMDICDRNSLSLFEFDEDDVIFHLAAHIFHPQTPSRGKRKRYFEKLNVGGTKNLLDCMKKNYVKRIAFLSTCMVYGVPKEKIIKTNHMLNPNGPYGATKIIAEELIKEFGQQENNRVLIFRPGLIAGPGRFGLLGKLSFLVKNNLPIPMIGSGMNRYQFISIYDCVDALIQFINLDFPNGIYNLGSKNPPIVKDLLNSLIEFAGSKSLLIPTWGYGVKKMLNILDILNLTLMYPEQFLLADSEFVLEISDLEEKLGFKPKYNDKDMLIEAYKSYLQEL